MLQSVFNWTAYIYTRFSKCIRVL